MTRSDALPLSTAFCTVSDEQAVRSWITAAPLPIARVEDTNACAASGKRLARSSARPSGAAAGGDGRGVDAATGVGAEAGATVGGAGRDVAAPVEGAADGAAGTGEGTTVASVVVGVVGRGEVTAPGAGDARAKSPGRP